ncbi:MAG: hypothetical protein GXY36_10425 [Chloroflexi bacterium]|nr:hypothetical protein [Chloroflexota bacterium]
MLNPFKMITRLAWLAVLLFGGGTAALVTLVVVATGGLGSSGLIQLPNQPPPAQTGAPAPPIQVTLNDVVEKRPLFENVPLPGEISTEPGVIATNLLLAIVLALLFGTISTTLGNLIREEEDTFRGWLAAVPGVRPLLRALGWGADQNVQRGCLTLPIIVAIFALYGVIFAFLERGLDLFSPEGVQLALVMAMSVGLISLAGDVAQRQVARFWGHTTRFGLYPANLLIAVATTAFSRVFHLSPGIVFGVPGGVDTDLDDAPRFHEVLLAIATLGVMAFLGVGGWLAAAAIRAAGDQTVSLGLADFAGPLAQLGLTIGLAIFLVAVETSFFEMIPLTATLGSDIFRWNKLLWFAAFVPVMFVFAHTLLNPDSDYLDAFQETNFQVLAAIIAGLGLITLGLWLYFRVLRGEPTAPQAVSPPHPVAPPPTLNQPPHTAPPPAQRPAAPPRHPPGGYTPPPIVISDDAPPPIIIQDDPPPKPPSRDDPRDPRERH